MGHFTEKRERERSSAAAILNKSVSLKEFQL